jgi:hypothetical protein
MTDNLNWNNLISFGSNHSQNDAFEELICQLARVYSEEKQCNNFVRFGTPDGGRECQCASADGFEWHWQAKFFQHTLTSNQWAKIQDSFESAFKKHPKLKKYFVCIPKNLPDGNTEGSEYKQWLRQIESWKQWAKNQDGRDIEFVLWGASEIQDFLSKEEHVGRRKFWFGEIEINFEKLTQTIKNAEGNAGERYHKELNVELEIKEIFEGLGLTGKFFNEFRKIIKTILQEKDFITKITDNYLSESLEKIIDESKQLSERENNKVKNQPVSFTPIKEKIRFIIQEINRLEDEYWKQREGLDIKDQRLIDKKRNSLSSIRHKIYDFERFLDSSKAQLVENPCLLLVGEAMIGKTHLFCDIANDRIKQGLPTILFLGDHFQEASHPVDQLIQFLDLKNTSRGEFFQALATFSEAQDKRLIIMIDAINESSNTRIWTNQLLDIIQKIKQYPSLAIAISVRDTEESIINQNTRNEMIYEFHKGFRGKQIEALKAYCGHFGLTMPQIPVFNPEFYNPGFLYITCQTLKNEGELTFITNKDGLHSLFQKYLLSINEKIAEKLNIPKHINCIDRAIKNLMPLFIQETKNDIPLENAQEAIVSALHSHIRDKSVEYLEQLIKEGLMRKIHSSRVNEIQITFSYQRFQDYLVVKELIEKYLNKQNPKESFQKDSLLYLNCYRFIRDERAINRRIIQALSIVLPEETGCELIELIFETGDSIDLEFIEAFCESLIWRSQSSITEATHKLLKNILENTNENISQSALKALLQLATIPNHPFNALYLHDLLILLSMNNRDEYWSMFIQSNDEGYGYSTHRNRFNDFIDWIWNADSVPQLNGEVKLLTSIILVWAFTSSNRFVRDKATKALTTLLINDLEMAFQLIKLFETVNDVYVEERLFASIYGATQRSKKLEPLKEIADFIYSKYFQERKPKPHILLRDYLRGIIEFSVYKKLDINIDETKTKPPYISEFPSIPDESIFKEYSERFKETDNWISKALGRVLLSLENEWTGDFYKYVLSSCSHYFLDCPINEERPRDKKKKLQNEFDKSLNNKQKSQIKKVDEAEIEMIQSMFFSELYCEEKFSEPAKIEEDDSSGQVDKHVFVPSMEAQSFYDREYSQLEKLLSVEQFNNYKKLKESTKYKESEEFTEREFNRDYAARWVLQRVFELGWTPEQFAYFDAELNQGNSREARKIERIGKKYQWIAFYEFLAYLSDNYHFKGWEENQVYEGPWQLSDRDIDPSFTLKLPEHFENQAEIIKTSWCKPNFTEEQLFGSESNDLWPNKNDFLPADKLISLVNENGKSYFLLQGYYEWKKLKSDSIIQDDLLSPSFEKRFSYLINSIFVKKDETQKILSYFKNKKFTLDRFSSQLHYQETYEEFFWRSTLSMPDWRDFEIDKERDTVKILPTTVEYYFEDGHDCSENRYSVHLPNKLLINNLGLYQGLTQGEFYDSSNQLIAFDPFIKNFDIDGLIMDAKKLVEFCDSENLDILWFVLSSKWKASPQVIMDVYAVYYLKESRLNELSTYCEFL